ncbi:hypothetical protein POF50_008215 [Streptomyces sp. SL13]|uniref:Uncharacterized protein n=1 Tax=Streptantibioticus silvisoli TaxID=2705255 RepID=A0AA90KFU0_9ACTN|nr:hypothetical protein [Streptantibioticus silvisoli]MDI5969329.1 hypothetical protein [Streptantibioticus silvisoli]
MLSVEDLRDAKPQAWRDAADDAIAAAKHCRAVASYARDDVAATLKMCWVSDAGRAARARFVQHAGDYEAAGDALHGLAKTYDTLADAVSDAQRTLHAALDHAAAHGLTVAGDGEVTGHASGHDQDAVHDQVTHAAGLIADALAAATRADSTAADEMRTITALTTITSPDLVAQALAHEADSPLGIALRLNQGPDGLHPLNISATQLDAIRQASQETGISQQLLMSIVWQEQQWYQNSDPGLGGPQALAGHLFDWALEQTVKPDKSLGITHMKIPTARQVIARDRAAFTVDGTYLDDLDDARLTKYIEQNPGEDIRLSAHYLRHTAVRGGAIRPRAEHWETLQPRLHDAGAWAALTNSQRQQALNEIAAQTPAGTSFDLSPLYTPPGVTTTGTGTGPAVPGIPSPAPGPAPTPPVG